MNILIAINSAYIQPAKVMLYSLAVHNQEYFDVYLLYNNIKDKEIRNLGNFISRRCHGELHPVEVDATCFQKFSVGGHFSIETYYRIYAQYLLPQSVERILWLDADVIVKDSIAEFYKTDFRGKCLIACENESEINGDNIKRLGLKRKQYFNAGVILMNLSVMRKLTSKEELEKVIDRNLSLFVWQDQDILNFLYDENTMIINGKFNCQVRGEQKDISPNIEQAAILHYVGTQKPWHYYYKDGVRDYYLFYLKDVNRKKYIQLQICSGLYRCLKGI